MPDNDNTGIQVSVLEIEAQIPPIDLHRTRDTEIGTWATKPAVQKERKGEEGTRTPGYPLHRQHLVF
jgi:hypothetical protein